MAAPRLPGAAARHGHVEWLRLLSKWDFSWDEHATLTIAALGHLECLQFVLEQGYKYEPCTLYIDFPD